MYLVCHVTPQDHLFKWSCDFMGAMLSVNWLSASGDKTHLIGHTTSKIHVIEESCDIMGRCF